MQNWIKGTSLAVLGAATLSTAASAQQVFTTDVIVQGSMCVGFDCANSESFGSDTLRLKENNLRVHFDDTSASASFPSNDWRILVNDTTNGGDSYWAIQDSTANNVPFRIDAGAGANAIVVEAGGFVGFGTTNPVLDLHVVQGNSPALRLEQDGSSGFQSQIWDVSGNETNFFIRDVTNSSRLPFKIIPGAATDSLYINASGNIGFGTASVDTPLHIQRATGVAEQFIKLENTGPTSIVFDNNEATNPADWRMGQSSNSTDFLIVSPDNPGPEMALTLTGDLEILGNYFSNGTQLNVPDYVFADDYELMSLEEVEAFIGANNHLPHIASAAEIAENGVNLSQMQMDLLKTVEELTLHTLAQQAEIDELRARLEQQ